jgi:trehalose 6-phosphate synthase
MSAKVVGPMLRSLRFVIPLLLGLATLAWIATIFVNRTNRQWAEKDVTLRSQLALASAQDALATRWNDPAALARLLERITRDERILGIAACDAQLRQLAATPEYPARFGCLGAVHLSSDGIDAEVRGGLVHARAFPLLDGERDLGFVVFVHDMAFAGRRESRMQWFTLSVFAILAFAAAGMTILMTRISWRRWTREMRQLLRGEAQREEFRPILGDVRELVARLSAEEQSGESRLWSPARLRQTLERHLHGEKVVIMANREPYIHERLADGGIKVVHPASGLVTALEPVMRACSGTWVAHGSGSADRQTVDRHDRVAVPPGEESYVVRRVWLTPEEEKGYYYGFSNEGMWPLCHIAHTRPDFRADDWHHYQRVNQKFADAVIAEADSDDPIVLVQDYHFALAPRMIREKLPRATIITFWHIPWPNSERFGICPWNEEILDGLLGSSIVGFHTQQHCNNFLDAVDRYLEARIDREQQGVVQRRRLTLIKPYPISIDWPNQWAAGCAPVEVCRREVRAQLGLAPDALLGVGVDRLDYTKGVEERLAAVERLLERFPHLRGKFTFVQLAAPSRTVIEKYRALNERVEALTARINDRFGKGAYRPIILLREHHEPPSVFRHYRAADLCYVSSLHDGMNLVAKEFVAARDDLRGVLILSQFTGAAKEMSEALIVNPYDLEAASSAMATALAMPEQEQAVRLRAMRTLLQEMNVYRWAGRMLVDAARLRQRDRLSGRLVLRSAGGA